MDRLDVLYQEAADDDIMVAAVPLRNEESFIIEDDGYLSIALNSSCIVTRIYEYYLMAHEMAHYHTGTYYTLRSPLQLREKQEYVADTWMVCDMVPINDLQEAIQEGYTEVWDLAEYFNVPERVVRRADEIYRAKGLL